MSKLTKQQDGQIEDMSDILSEDMFCDEDYVFVLGPDGQLKTAMIPDETPFEIPESVNKILNLFGISDVDMLAGNDTIH